MKHYAISPNKKPVSKIPKVFITLALTAEFVYAVKWRLGVRE
jgi:hypothetical protein